MNADSRSLVHKSSMGIATIVRSLGIEKINVNTSPTRHQTSQAMNLRKVTLMIGIMIPGIVVVTIKNMDIFLRIALGHISKVTIKYG